MGLLAVLPADGTWASVVHMLGDAFSDVVADDPRAPDAVVLADLFARASRTG
jgi:hypothetical protein